VRIRVQDNFARSADNGSFARLRLRRRGWLSARTRAEWTTGIAHPSCCCAESEADNVWAQFRQTNNNRKPKKGNNRHGNKGTIKCEDCRRLKRAVRPVLGIRLMFRKCKFVLASDVCEECKSHNRTCGEKVMSGGPKGALDASLPPEDSCGDQVRAPLAWSADDRLLDKILENLPDHSPEKIIERLKNEISAMEGQATSNPEPPRQLVEPEVPATFYNPPAPQVCPDQMAAYGIFGLQPQVAGYFNSYVMPQYHESSLNPFTNLNTSPLQMQTSPNVPPSQSQSSSFPRLPPTASLPAPTQYVDPNVLHGMVSPRFCNC
jgi:hypothetical protein